MHHTTFPLMLPRFIDSTAPFDFVAKNGYYQIGDSFASHVGPACQEATRTNQTIQWHFGNEVYNNFNSDVAHFFVKTGDLIIFPSSTEHKVPIRNNESTRISLAFNTFLRGEFGNNSYRLKI